MPRNGSGVYTLPSGNPVVPGTTIDSTWANDTLEDMANEITNSLSRTGAGGMLAPFRVADGTSTAPGLAFTNETNSGLYRSGTGNTALVVTGVPVIQMTASSVTVPTGKVFNAQGGAAVTGTLSATGAVTFSSTFTVTGAITATGGVAGNVTGNVTAASGTSTFYNAVVTNGLNMSGVKIAALGTPTTDTDAATKAYVDSVAQGIDAKASCLVATTANITLSGTQTIDGVAVTAGQRVLVKDQSSAAENGIYVCAAGAWSRSSDANTWDELVAAFTFIEQGTVNANSGYICTVAAGGTLGSTAVPWTQFSGAGQITAGAGLVKSGNTLNVQSASASRIVVGADEIDLAATGVTAATYKSVTVDIYGRVTGGSNPITLAGYGITDAYTSSYIDSLFGTTASAASSASAAAASASAASTSASNASTSATNAATSLFNFKAQYLGASSSNPTVDGNGNALTAGDLYYNSSANEMRVYSGSGWVAAYLPASGYLALTGGTMTGAITFVGGQTFPGTLVSGDLGVTVQPYDVDTAKLDAVQTFSAAQTFGSGNLKLAGSTSGAATLNAPAVAGTNTYALPPDAATLGYRNVPAVGTKTGSYTLAVGDVGKYVQIGTGGSITIPTSTFSEGDAISLFNNTTGNITITCSAPTTYIAGTDSVKTSLTLATRGVATVLFISGTVCVVTGNVT